MSRRPSGCNSTTHLTFESWLSFLKLERIAALSFCTTARSSAIVFAARTFRMNCFTMFFQHMHTAVRDAWRTRCHCGGLWDPTQAMPKGPMEWRFKRIVDGVVGRSKMAFARVARPLLCCRCWLMFDEHGKAYGGPTLFQSRPHLPCLTGV